ncbi:transketolase [Candidatus Thorarchaeota archaeon]|nr:MAG: transketolase [Candidatus Thorarchaeota archaeon]
MPSKNDLQERAINTIRFLSADAVQRADSGHPGMPMGAAAMAYALWTRHLRFNPKNPDWANRDRFILSGGHGSMLLYSLLHLTGYDLTLDDIKDFRQWDSSTPGHPECWKTPGVEVTTGPLGQGFGNSVGMAIAEAHLAAEFNRGKYEVVDHYTYVIATDGDLMEGISSEAASLAGHLQLGKLIVLYDDNDISIDGSTDLTFTEDVAKRFEAFHWHIQRVDDGNNVETIDEAISKAKQDPRPSIIIVRTHIGYGLPTKQDSAASHGAPAGEEELTGAKKQLGWPEDKKFYIPEDVLEHFREAIDRGRLFEEEWTALKKRYAKEYPDLHAELQRRLEGELPQGWDSDLPVFAPDEKGIATRAASGKTINSLASHLPELIGGSADLTGSNKTWIDDSEALQKESYGGQNIYFGVREHAMAAAVNGMARHGGVIPYAGTFFIFSDYMRPAVRLSALSRHPSIWVYTHDSIGLGEDGPTHQPVEQLPSLRAMPNLVLIRPADANEVTEAWRAAIKRRNGPTAIVLTRQKIPVLDRERYASAQGLKHGAYVLKDFGEEEPDIILMASGSEVNLIVKAGEILHGEGVNVRVISFPSWELFAKESQKYQQSVLLPTVRKRLAVEAAVPFGWERWIGEDGLVIGTDSFGASAPGNVMFEKFGFTVENVISHAKKLLA